MEGQDCIATMLHMRYRDHTSGELKELLKSCSTTTGNFLTELERLQKDQLSNNEE